MHDFLVALIDGPQGGIKRTERRHAAAEKGRGATPKGRGAA